VFFALIPKNPESIVRAPNNKAFPQTSEDTRENVMSMSIRLRPATLSDLALLRHWDKQPHVIAAGGDWDGDDFDWETELPRRHDWRELLIAERDGRPVGFIQIIDPQREETHYWGNVEPNLRAINIWIGEAADLGRGYGTEMMRLALERCFADPAVTTVLIDPLTANTRAHRFYERCGFVCVERRMFGKDDCLVYRLERNAWRSTG
jgi:aminoglycoside 6'-N-acetyltransferase